MKWWIRFVSALALCLLSSTVPLLSPGEPPVGVARAALAPPSPRDGLSVGRGLILGHGPSARPHRAVAAVAALPWSPSVTEALVAGATPVPAGQSDNWPDNFRVEPSIARDPVTGHFVATAADFAEYAHVANAGISGVYTSPDALQWSQPSFTAGTSSGCQWTSDILPGYCDLGYSSLGDVTVAFGPRPDAANHFSYANGARAYISNDYCEYANPQASNGIAVSHSDDDGASWPAPTVVVGVTPDFFTATPDKSVVWADGDPRSPCFGTVYDAWTLYLQGNTAQEHGPVLLARSTDGGSSFSAPLTVTAPRATDDTAVGAIRTLRDGAVVVAWGSFGAQATQTGTGPSAIQVALSHDCGQHFGAPVTVAPLSEGNGVSTFFNVPGTRARVSSIPSMDTDGTSLYATWSEIDPATDSLVVRATRSADGGSSWSPSLLVSGPTGGSAFMPAVGAAGDRVVISYATVSATSTTPGPGVASLGMLYALATPALQVLVRHPLTARSGDPDGTYGFVGDYTSIITSGHGDAARAYPIWTDDRDAVPCPQYDAWAAGQNPPYPDVNHVCPAGWGTSEIRAATVSLARGQSGDNQP